MPAATDPAFAYTRTERGFELVEFHDAHTREASLQASSLIGPYPDAAERPGTSYLWLGRDDPDHARLLLSREQVGELVRRMSAWLETGSLRLEGDTAPPA